jgi:cytochrome P450
VISSAAAVKEILDLQSTVTGGRPTSHVQHAYKGMYAPFESMDNVVWKRSRKAMTRFLTTDNLNTYMATQKVEYVQMLNDVLDNPDVWQVILAHRSC